ncbi:hypothetical protein BDP67DRAFT_510363 [Colletotrichum lupini]|nr:hypothetical protein BDP67DRAFT_510363 [Colletotrichum lupini]
MDSQSHDRLRVTGEDFLLCSKLWPALERDVFEADHYAVLATYVRAEINWGQIKWSKILPGVDDTEKIRAVMACARELDKQPVERVLQSLENHIALPEQLHGQAVQILSVAASLHTMSKVRLTAPSETETHPSAIWAPGFSLIECVRTIFNRMPNLEDRSISLKLTISNLARYNKCIIVWTDRLDKHLDYRLSRHSKVIFVFQHKIWLSAHINQQVHCTIPKEVICEALDTLNLLFPHNDRDTESFLKTQGQRFYSLGNFGRGPRLNLKDYPHWGPKIEKLIDVFEGPRSGIWRFLPRHDQSDLLESANFWIATAAAFIAFVGFILGLASIIFAKLSYDIGIKSMAISEESLKLTQLQYQLSLAQACSDPNEARLLPDFCSAEE